MWTWLNHTTARICAFFRASEDDRDFGEELESHLAMLEAEKTRQGMTREQAHRAARVELGGIEQLREAHRETRGLPLLETVLQDLRYGVRMLRRDAAPTGFAVVIVGLGVGACSIVFSVVHTLLLRPLPFEEPERLVWIANGDSLNLSDQTVQVNNLLALREQSESFSGIAAYSPFYGPGDIRLSGAGEPERVTGVPVTETFFPLLGAQPRLGRSFTPEECVQNAPSTVVLSYRFWERRFGSDPDIVGQAILLNGEPATVVGVAPESFDFAGVFAPGTRADLFRPFPLSPESNRRGNTLALIGRLKPGADLSAAQAEAAVIGERVSGRGETMRSLEGASRNDFHPNLSTLRDRVSGRLRNALLVLAGAVGFLMLLVCVNLSNLLLARASARQKEMAVRAALGAGRRRLVRQLLIESLMLSGCGAALGLVVAIGGTTLLARIEGVSVPLLQQVRVDGAALAFTLLAALLTGVAFGLMPALQASSVSPQAALVESSRGSTAGLSRSRLRRSLVVCEIGLACMLLTGAGLLLRSLDRVLHVELGFDAENLMALRIDPGREHSTRLQRTAYFNEVLSRVRSVPGVNAVGLTDALPFGDNYGWRTWSSSTPGSDQRLSPLVRIVDQGYLSAMRIPIRAGRGFTAADDTSSEPVIVVNETLARRLWPNKDPLGQVLETSGDKYRVIGVVRESRYFALERESGPEMYLLILQKPDYSSLDLVVRTSHSPEVFAPGIRETLRSVDPNLPTTEFRTMRQLVDNSVFARRFVVFFIGGFAVFGLVLAALGIYGLISYSVSQRRQEIGIRMALGARAADLQKRIVLQSLKGAALGVAIGLAASWGLGRAIQGLLFDVAPSDPVTFTAAIFILLAVAVLAGYLPARRVSRIDPASALRAD
jgi:predicted permease